MRKLKRIAPRGPGRRGGAPAPPKKDCLHHNDPNRLQYRPFCIGSYACHAFPKTILRGLLRSILVSFTSWWMHHPLLANAPTSTPTYAREDSPICKGRDRNEKQNTWYKKREAVLLKGRVMITYDSRELLFRSMCIKILI